MNFSKTSSLIPFLVLKKQQSDLIETIVSKSANQLCRKYQNEELLRKNLIRIIESELATSQKKINDRKKDSDFWMDMHATTCLSFKEEDLKEILKSIAFHYAYGIHGKFSLNHYKVAKKCVAYTLNKLLSPFNLSYLNSQYSIQNLDKRIIIEGQISDIQKIAKTHTIVALPTHFSNLDSGIIFWALSKIGLPPFVYGAGLNLFSTKFWNYTLSRVGTYKIDRLKKNPLYLTVLMLYMEEAIIRGCHSLFYPHGTRSRNGNISKEIKKGLLFSVLKAQEKIFDNARNKQIVFLPIVLNYPFVLEGELLSKNCLKEDFFAKNATIPESQSPKFKLLNKIIRTTKVILNKSYLTVRFGPMLDLLGNELNISGIDSTNLPNINNLKKLIDDKDYYASNQHLNFLEEKIFEAYNKNTTILASQLISYCGACVFKKLHYETIAKTIQKLDYSKLTIPLIFFTKIFTCFVNTAKHMASNNICYIEERIKHYNPDDLLKEAINEIDVYHPTKPLYINKHQHIATQNLALLFYYGNRLKNFENEFKSCI